MNLYAKKSSLQQAGIRSLHYNDLQDKFRDSQLLQKNIPSASYARTYHLRQENINPQDKLNNEFKKEAYKRDLIKQIEDQRKRKQLQKIKNKQFQINDQKQYFQKNKLVPKRNLIQQPNYVIMRSGQRNRYPSQKKQNSNLKTQPISNSTNRGYDYYPTKNIYQSITPTRFNQPTSSYQRSSNIFKTQRQQSIQNYLNNDLQKMQHIKTQIEQSTSNLGLAQEIQKIRSLLKGKSIIDLPSHKNIQKSKNNKQEKDYSYQLKNKLNENIYNNSNKIQLNELFQKIEGTSSINYDQYDQVPTELTEQQDDQHDTSQQGDIILIQVYQQKKRNLKKQQLIPSPKSKKPTNRTHKAHHNNPNYFIQNQL